MSSSNRNDTSWALGGGGDDFAFDDMMAQLGVRPIGKEPPKKATPPPPPKKAAPSPQERAAAQREAARKVLQPEPAAAPVAVVAPAASELVGRVEELEQQLSAAKAALAAEREARLHMQERLRELEAARDRAVGQAESLQRDLEEQELQLRRLKRRLAGTAGDDAAPASPQLSEVLERRGLKGTDEAAFLIRGLLQTRQLDGLLDRLQADDPDLLGAWLEDRVTLLCSSHAELAPSGRAGISVPPPRCEVCGGGELKRTVRHFVDTCLVNGMTRVSVVGGSPKHHHMLRGLLQHRALRVQLAPSLEQRTASQVRSDLDNSDVVLVWTRGERPELAEPYQVGGPARVVVGAQDSIVRLLADAAEQLLRG